MKKTMILRRITEVILFVLMVLFYFWSIQTTDGWNPWYILSWAIILLAFLTIRKVRKLHKILQVILLLLWPSLTFLTVENYTHLLSEMRLGPAILNVILYYLIFLVLTMITGYFAAGYMIGMLIPTLFGLANYFIILFRSSPILPWDLYSLKVAASVADNMEYVLSVKALNVLMIIAFMMILLLRVEFHVPLKRIRLIGSVLSLAVLIGFCRYVSTDEAAAKHNIDQTLFTPKVLYRNNGFMLGFLVNTRYLKIEKPGGYSPDSAMAIADNYKGSEAGSEIRPNIIVVMNEAFSDLRILGDYETNIPVMPNIDAMTDNVQKGWMYASVKGGNTANTEYEFLTGDSLYFLPVGSVAYQQYIRRPMESIPGNLRASGYRTIAMHPYNTTGWNRNVVYDHFGFDEMYFLKNFHAPELIRNYVSDAETYRKIIDLYENKEADERLFVFDVTMQNHGSYTKLFDNLQSQVQVIGGSGKYLYATEYYLTLLHISDQAFKEMTDYFSRQDEPTVILMFGDHQPADYLVGPVSQEKEDSLESQQKRYEVPYILWANYDIPESFGEEISANFLGLRLMEAAGISLTGYQQFLKDLNADYPVVTGNVVKTKGGTYYGRDSKEADEILKEYGILQYNHLVEKRRKIPNFFDIGGN